MITGTDHTSFTVGDMEKSIAFYRDVLEMKVTWDSLKEGLRFKGSIADHVTNCPGTEQRLVMMTVGNCRIELVEYAPSGKPLVENKASDTGSAHVCFKTDNIQALYRKLKETGVRLHCEPQDLGFARVMYFRDPDGIILEALEGELPGQG